MPLLAVGIGAVVGIVLGLLGAGGSLLTVPALIFLLGLTITEATGTSLLVVIAMSATGLWVHRRAGRCSCRQGLIFAGAGTIVAIAASRLALELPEVLLTVAFVAVLLAAAAWILRASGESDVPEGKLGTTETPKANRGALLGAGAGVGALTGLLGVGGGFVIVPALRSTMKIDVRKAIGTSQLVVLINAVAALAGRAGAGIEWGVGIPFALGGVIGALIGAKAAGRVDPARLRVAFAVIAIVVALVMVSQLILEAAG